MKTAIRVLLIIFFFSFVIGGLIGYFTTIQEWSVASGLLLLVPFVASGLLSYFTVYEHGNVEQRREVSAAFVVYLVLGILTVGAYATGESVVREKFLDAFLFGQVVTLLSIFKTCLTAWGNPTLHETLEEKSKRLAAAKEIRRANFRTQVINRF